MPTRVNKPWSLSCGAGRGLEATRQTHDAWALLHAEFATHGLQIKFQTDAVVRTAGDPAQTVYRVDRGTLRCCAFAPDGQRRVLRFSSPGDVIGIAEAAGWHVNIEAVDCVVLTALPWTRLQRALTRSPVLYRALLDIAAEDILQREQALIQATANGAKSRVLGFLTRFAADRGKTGVFALPMSRRDIGDHLGLSIETVSRAFTALRACGAIEMPGANKISVRAVADAAARQGVAA